MGIRNCTADDPHDQGNPRQLGEDGWELVTVLPGASAPAGATPASNMVAPTQGNPIAYFKREKAD